MRFLLRVCFALLALAPLSAWGAPGVVDSPSLAASRAFTEAVEGAGPHDASRGLAVRDAVAPSQASDAAETPPAEASGPARWQVFTRMGSRWITDPALDLFSDADALFTVGIGVQYHSSLASDRLSFEIAFDTSFASALSFETLQSRLDVRSVGAAVVYRLPAALPLAPKGKVVARAGGSWDWFSARLEDDRSPSFALAQTTSAFGLQGNLGYELEIPFHTDGPPDGTAFVLQAGAGYALYPSNVHFDDLRRDVDSDAKPKPIRTRGAALGELDPSGFLLRFTLGVRF